MKGPLRKENGSRGFVLLVSYVLLAALSIFSIALFTRGAVFLQSAERNKKKLVAFNVAEAGFDDALARLRNNQILSFPWQSGYVALDTGNLQGGYQVTVTDMGGGTRQIASTGYSPNMAAGQEIQETRSVTGYVSAAPASAFPFGIFARDSMDINGNNSAVVDSYDSRLNGGVYGGTNVGQNGHIGTDSIATAAVKLSGNVTINGNVNVGPGGNPATVISAGTNVTITGARQAQSQVQNLQTISSTIQSSGDLSLSGQTSYMLSAGAHRFSSISVSGGAALKALGPVQIYVDGPVSISGNALVTVNDIPTNFLMYVTTASTVSVSGNGTLFAGVYAPTSAVSNTGGGTLFGAVTSKTYQQTGTSKLHYDEALKNVAGSGGQQLQVHSWTEQNLTAQSASTVQSGQVSS